MDATASPFQPIEMAVDQRDYWRIANLELWVRRADVEWRLASRVQPDTPDPTDRQTFRHQAQADPPPAGLTVRRCAARATSAPLQLVPALPDRAVVVRPEEPFSVLPGESITLYLISRLWVRVEAGAERRLLMELPTRRLSDTWFGASTREGELCYAARTHARLSLNAAAVHPARAITELGLTNKAADALALERIKIPYPLLDIFLDRQGRLWTNAITFNRGIAGKNAEFHIDRRPPESAGVTQHLTPPRKTVKGHVLRRAVSAFFG